MKQFNASQSSYGAIETKEIRDPLADAVQLVDKPATAERGLKITGGLVRALIKVRRSRDRYFDAKLFADPAWDMLLELYAAELEHLRVSVSSLCIGAVPPTTALRWINALECKGLITRTPDPLDRRRVFVSLTRETVKSMEKFFRSVPAGMPLS